MEWTGFWRRVDMWVKRMIAIAVIVTAIVWLVPKFKKIETETMMGLAVSSEETLRQQWGERTFYDSLDNAKELLLFNGSPVPYDKDTNTFYITQNVENGSFDGEFGVSDSKVDAYFLSDGYETTKSTGIYEGHVYRIWLCDDSCASICNVIFTGLPVISVDADGLPEVKDDENDNDDTYKTDDPEYIDGEIAVWSSEDEDLGGISDRGSRIECKRSASGETITCKLRSKDGSDNKKVSLLSMGKHDAWKLYKVPETDETSIRMMMAYRLWNECTNVDKLSVPCRFVELVLNDGYEGLYILRPRTDDDYFDLPDEDMVIKLEDTPAEDEIYGTYSPQNAAEYGLWLQATGAYVNLYEDVVVIDDGRDSLFLPGKAEYVFGSFPGRYAYLGYQFDQRIITAAEFKRQGEEADALGREIASLWIGARQSFLGDEAIITMAQDMITELKKTGLTSRREITDENIAAFVDGIRLRYAYVDRYYEELD